MHLRTLLTLLSFLFFTQTEPPTGDPPKSGDDPPADPPRKVEFTEEQQREVSRIAAREARKAAEKARADRDAEIAAERKQAEEEAERRKAEEAGEFDKVKASLTTERDTAIGERDRLKDENDALTAYFTAQYEAALADLPQVITAFKPHDDASFEVKSKWLTTAKEQAKAFETQSPRGNGPNPKPSTGERNLDAAERAARQSGRYTA